MATVTTSEEIPANTTMAYRVTVEILHCLVGGCGREIAAEVNCGDWGPTLEKMGFRVPHKQRRPGDARVFVCEEHMADKDLNARLGDPRWQRLFDYDER